MTTEKTELMPSRPLTRYWLTDAALTHRFHCFRVLMVFLVSLPVLMMPSRRRLSVSHLQAAGGRVLSEKMEELRPQQWQ